MSIRDANVIIIEISRELVRARLGLYDLLKTPSVEILARVGQRPSDAPAALKDYLVGPALDDALASAPDIILSSPFADAQVADWVQAEAILKHILFTQLQRKRVQNESPVLLCIPPGLSRDAHERFCQIFFERFNVPAFAILERPIAQIYAVNSLNGIVVDIGDHYTDITAVYDGFILHPSRSSVPLGKRHCSTYLAHLLKANQGVLNALSPPSDPLDPETLHSTLLELVQHMINEGMIKVPSDGETAAPEDEGVTDIAAIVVAGREKAVIESGMKKKATAKASAAEQARAREIEALDLITVQFKNHSLTIGKERHRFCEPLFDPSLLADIHPNDSPDSKPLLPLQDVVAHVVNQADVDQRQYIWNGLLVTGPVTTNVKGHPSPILNSLAQLAINPGIDVALQSRLAPFIASPELLTDVQARSTRVLAASEFFAEYRGLGNGYAAFLGSSITAKIIFADPNSKNFVSKADYTQKGPHSIIEMNPALL